MEERNEVMEQETNQEVTEKTEENQTPVVVEDNFGAGLIIGGTVVLGVGTVVKIWKNRKKICNWVGGLFGRKKPEETDEPIDTEASEVEESEDEEE